MAHPLERNFNPEPGLTLVSTWLLLPKSCALSLIAWPRLAGEFVQRVLPPSAARDAVHLAAAAANKLDYLLTWNCAHLANAQILKRLDPVAEAAGYKLPRVCTPEELMGMSGYE